MGLEYNLGEIEPKEKVEDLKLELSPRNQCRDYVRLNGGKATLIPRSEFDAHFIKKKFADGPFMDSFGDGNEPYNPNRQGYGRLKSGLIVYCETSEAFKEKSEELLELFRERKS